MSTILDNIVKPELLIAMANNIVDNCINNVCSKTLFNLVFNKSCKELLVFCCVGVGNLGHFFKALLVLAIAMATNIVYNYINNVCSETLFNLVFNKNCKELLVFCCVLVSAIWHISSKLC